MELPNLDLTLGSLLIATWVNVSLYTVELGLAWKYWRTMPNDSRLNRVMVATLVVVDSISTACICGVVYHYCVSSFARPEKLADTPLTLPIDLLMVGITGAVVEGFFILRVHRLLGATCSGVAKYAVSFVLMAVNLASFSASVWFVVYVRIFSTYDERAKLATPLIWWLASVAGVDVTTAIIMAYLLWKVKSSVKDFGQSRSDGIIRRLIRISIASGAVPAANALTGLICYHFTSKTINVYVGLGFIAGRLYSLSLLGNLLMRKSTTSLPPTSLRVDTIRQAENGTARPVALGVSVTRLSIVNFEDDEEVPYSMENFGRRKSLANTQTNQPSLPICEEAPSART